jgi:biotin-dependent carboxylase-like uncharacterized protein
MEFIEILKAGMLTTIQDRGRASYQKYGISACGAMDSLSLRLANILVGNWDGEAAIEVTMVGPKLKFWREGVIAIAGADLSPSINGKSIGLWKSIRVASGDTLSFGLSRDGCCRAYIAVAGGIDVPRVMGSRSTFTRGSFGGFEGRALKAGDVLQAGPPRRNIGALAGRMLPPEHIPGYKEERAIRFLLGPQADAFSEESIRSFESGVYRIMNESDRMGFRLEGTPVAHLSGPDIISDYITMGSIQIPGNGQPIVLMSDCQMTGGYSYLPLFTIPSRWYNVVCEWLSKTG